MLKSHRPQSHMSTWLFHVNIGYMENTGFILCLFFSFSEVGCINSDIWVLALPCKEGTTKLVIFFFFLVPHSILFKSWLLSAWKTLCNEVQSVSLSHDCSCHDSFQQQSHHIEHCTSNTTVHPSLFLNFYFSEHLCDCSTTLKNTPDKDFSPTAECSLSLSAYQENNVWVFFPCDRTVCWPLLPHSEENFKQSRGSRVTGITNNSLYWETVFMKLCF